MTAAAGTRPGLALRRAVLVFALREPGPLAEVVVTDAGPCLPDGTLVGWDELAEGCGDDEELLTRRVGRWLRLRAHLAALVARAGPDVLLGLVRPVALPVGHVLAPGPRWASYEVLGGALEVGLGLKYVDDDGRVSADRVGVLPLGVLRAAGVETEPLQAQAQRVLADMSVLAVERLLRMPGAPLRPLGDCDVLTLLAAPGYRAALVHDSPGVVGLRCAAVPDRRRGWLDLGRVDPAFALAAASLAEPDERGFSRPVLVTADEVVQVRAGGTPTRHALADPLGPDRVEPIRRLP